MPRFTRAVAATDARLGTPAWMWPALLLLALVLIAQVAISARDVLGADPRTRPLALFACRVAGCTLMPLSQPDRLRMLDSGIHAHPTQPGVLVAEASFRNDAPWPQAWPLLQLTLSDVNGRIIARGRYTAAQYLHGSTTHDIGAGQTASIQLNVQDPAQPAVSFDFSLLPATGGVAAPAVAR